MAKKQLKVNMIFGGEHHSFGSVLEEDAIPPNLRKPEYLEDPAYIDDDDADIDIDDIIEEEPKPKPKPKISVGDLANKLRRKPPRQ